MCILSKKFPTNKGTVPKNNAFAHDYLKVYCKNRNVINNGVNNLNFFQKKTIQ